MSTIHETKNVLNVNLGVLGHVDSGKTALVAALSTTLSTAALDKHPQSKERGITLDLGFSSFQVPLPPHILAQQQQQQGEEQKEQQEEPPASSSSSSLQITLVDCPGHASLVRTIIGGAQIIDFMMLVVDITRGIQPQTAECIVIGEVCCIGSCRGGSSSDDGDNDSGSGNNRNKQEQQSKTRRPSLIVALNKIDLIPEDKRDKYIKKATKMVTATLNATKFAGSFVIVPVSALQPQLNNGVETLLQTITTTAPIPQRDSLASPFLFIIDHCFAIKGQGTVVTGTVARGTASVGDTIEFPTLGQQKKIKSMQAFHQPRLSCSAGDRLGICVSQLDAKLIERGVACAPGAVSTFECAVALVEKVRYYEGEIGSRSRMHVIIGHSTVMAELLFFTLPSPGNSHSGENNNSSSHSLVFDMKKEYRYVDTLEGEGEGEGEEGEEGEQVGAQWAYIKFSSPITAPTDSLLIGAKLDADISTLSQCRLAFSGQLQQTFPTAATIASDKTSSSNINSSSSSSKSLKVFKEKYRRGVIERLDSDGTSAICKGMFSKDTDMSVFSGMQVVVEETGKVGEISGGFGKSGKFRVSFSNSGSSGGGSGGKKEAGQVILLKMKKYIKV